MAATALTSATLVASRLYAMPFPAPTSITLDRIGVTVATIATGCARFGIFTDAGVYPNALLVDSGSIAVNVVGVASAALNVTLSPGMHWLAIKAASNPTIRGFAVAGVIPVLGFTSALGTAANAGFAASHSGNALPSTFPLSASVTVATPIPAIFVRLSAS
jgi:hypothetical protein